MWLSTSEICAAQFGSVTEIRSKSPFLCVNRALLIWLSCQRKSYPFYSLQKWRILYCEEFGRWNQQWIGGESKKDSKREVELLSAGDDGGRDQYTSKSRFLKKKKKQQQQHRFCRLSGNSVNLAFSSPEGFPSFTDLYEKYVRAFRKIILNWPSRKLAAPHGFLNITQAPVV